MAAAEAGEVDAITFASPSAVTGLRELIGNEDFDTILGSVVTAVIGETTSRSLTEYGHPPDAMADPSTLEGLARAVIEPLAGAAGRSQEPVNERSEN